LAPLFAELLGRADGCCGGKGGSMHLTDFNVGVLGSFAIVGAHLPISAGAALTAVYRGTDAVSVCFFGDGATNIGAFHETLNVAAVWKLPMIFVCENNLWGEYSPIATTTSTVQLVDRGASYGVWSERVDGNDVEAVETAAEAAVAHARAGNGPAFIEALTYRHKGHSARTDAGRPSDEIAEWMARDPLLNASRRLSELGVSDAAIAAIRDEVDAEVADAAAMAEASPEPPLDQLTEDVYA
jgi:pyruvate dehydrogenase E1 component alpha subunit